MAYPATQVILPSEYMTLSDAMKFLKGDKDPLSLIVDEYVKVQTLGADIPVTQASDRLEDNGYFEEPWEFEKASHTTDLDRGVRFFKTGTYQRKDIMGMRGSAIAINKGQYDAAGSAADLWRARQTFQRARWLALDKEHDMFFGDPAVDPNQNLGLAPRFSVLTDEDGIIKAGSHQGELSPYITIDAGGYNSSASSGAAGSDGTLASVYICYMSSTDGLCWIYPSETRFTAGISYEKGSFQDSVTDFGQGSEVVTQAFDKFKVVGGVAMKSRKSVIRIANIDFKTTNGIAAFDKALYRAFEALPLNMQSSAKLYCPKKAVPELKMYYRDKMLTNVNTYEGAKPVNLRGDFSIDGMLFRKCEQLGINENHIA